MRLTGDAILHTCRQLDGETPIKVLLYCLLLIVVGFITDIFNCLVAYTVGKCVYSWIRGQS